MMLLIKLENVGDLDLGRYDDEFGFGDVKLEVFVGVFDREI